ncbi:unnamed protein product [Caenorhabditis angaria]|uniref:Uncharacterized protein n=1 Tax=Caenorhabditis angaria TaxID=860376 RepID=A0A9P1I7L5_9PELO|nr:unnamed protein product [Caenorhabditis angaria]
MENEPRKIIGKSNETLKKARKSITQTTVNIDDLVSDDVFFIKLNKYSFYNDVSNTYKECQRKTEKITDQQTNVENAVYSCSLLTVERRAELYGAATHIRRIEKILNAISSYLTNEVERRFLAFNNIFELDSTLLLQQFENDIDQLVKFCDELLNQSIKMEMRTFFIVFFIFFLFYSLILAIFIVLSILGYFILFKEPPIPPQPVIELPPRGYVPEKTEIPIPKPKQSKMQNFVNYSLYGSILLLFISSITYLVIYLEVLEPTNNCEFKKNNDSISLISICPTPNSEFFSILPFGSSFSQTGLEKSLNFSENKKRFDEKADKSLGYKEYEFNDVGIDFNEEVGKMSYFGKGFENLKEINCTDEILDDASTDFKHLHSSLVELNSSIVKFNEKRIKSKHFIDMFETHPFDEIRQGTRIAVAPILAANFKCTTIYELIYANCRLNGFVLDDFVFYVIIQLSSNTIVIFFNFVILELKKVIQCKTQNGRKPSKIIGKSNEILTKARESIAQKTVNIGNLVSGDVFFIKLNKYSFYDDVFKTYETCREKTKKISDQKSDVKNAVNSCSGLAVERRAELNGAATHIRRIGKILDAISSYLSNEVESRFLAFDNIFSINIKLLLQQFENDIDQLLKFCEELLNQPIKMEIRTLFIVFFIFFSLYSLILAIFIVLSILGYFILFKEPPIPPEMVIELPPRGYVPEKTEIPIPKPKQSKMQNFVKYSLYGSILLLFISSITYLVIYLEVLEPTNNCAFKKNNDSISLISICPTPNSEFFSILPFGSSFSQTGLEKSLNFSENKKRFDEKADKSLGYKEFEFGDVGIDFDEEVEKMSYFGKEFENLKEINCTDEILDDASTDFEHLHTSLICLKHIHLMKFDEEQELLLHQFLLQISNAQKSMN